MNEQGIINVVLRLLRSALLLDAGVAAALAVFCFVNNLASLEAYGTFLTWAGFAIIILASILGAGGLSSQMRDVADFSLTRAGNMAENLRQIAESKNSSLGCLILLVSAGLGLLGLGYIVKLIESMIL